MTILSFHRLHPQILEFNVSRKEMHQAIGEALIDVIKGDDPGHVAVEIEYHAHSGMWSVVQAYIGDDQRLCYRLYCTEQSLEWALRCMGGGDCESYTTYAEVRERQRAWCKYAQLEFPF